MSTVVETPGIKRACSWIAEEQASGSRVSFGKLAMLAGQRFDLSPLEAEFLFRLVQRAKDEGIGEK